MMRGWGSLRDAALRRGCVVRELIEDNIVSCEELENDPFEIWQWDNWRRAMIRQDRPQG